MSDDFVKRGVPTGMSMFAKIGIVLTAGLVLGGLFVGYSVNMAYAEITELVEDRWVRIARQDPAMQSIVVNGGAGDRDMIWGVSAHISIENRNIWFHQAVAQGKWTNPEGQVLNFDMHFIKERDAWQLIGIQLTR